MELLHNYLFFLAKIITFVIAIIVVIACIAAIITKVSPKRKAELCIESLNERYEGFKQTVYASSLTKNEYKEFNKALKTSKKNDENRQSSTQKKIFVIKFCGDTKASQIEALRQEITAVLVVAEPLDEVLVCVKSPGGTVPGYGFAAAQLKRLRDHNIRLTVAVDEIAASGGYMMAAVADHIIAAPFAILGSVGVVGQLPNFNRWLKENYIDYELHTAGEFKRSLTFFGENTDKARGIFKEELEQAHELFKTFLKECRPQLDVDAIATGKYWYGAKALELKLVDQLISSDEYLLMNLMPNVAIYTLEYKTKPTMLQQLKINMRKMIQSATMPTPSIEDRVLF